MGAAATDSAVHAPAIADRLRGEQAGHGTAGGRCSGRADPGVLGDDATLAAVGVDAGDVKRGARPLPNLQDELEIGPHARRIGGDSGEGCEPDAANRLGLGILRRAEQVERTLLARSQRLRRSQGAQSGRELAQARHLRMQPAEVAAGERGRHDRAR